MPIHDRLRIMTALVVAAIALSAVSASAQTPAETPAPEAKPAPAAPAEPARPAMMTDGARIKLCKKKSDQPLEPSSTPASRIGGTIARPTIIRKVDPQFHRSGQHGTIVLEAIIDEDGCVREVKVLRSLNPAQDAVATDALRQWVFRPALFDGEPVRVYYSLTMNYH